MGDDYLDIEQYDDSATDAETEAAIADAFAELGPGDLVGLLADCERELRSPDQVAMVVALPPDLTERLVAIPSQYLSVTAPTEQSMANLQAISASASSGPSTPPPVPGPLTVHRDRLRDRLGHLFRGLGRSQFAFGAALLVVVVGMGVLAFNPGRSTQPSWVDADAASGARSNSPPVNSRGSSQSTGTPTPPTAEELASSLITDDDYKGDWTAGVSPDAAASGVITDNSRNMLPRLSYLCGAVSAESRAAADALTWWQWQAFRQLDLTLKDPIDPPDNQTGPLVTVREFLTSAEPGEIETTFNLLRSGFQACLGDIPSSRGGLGTLEAMTIPDVGDDRYGVLIKPKGNGPGAGRQYYALVRQGPVLMLLDVFEITGGEHTEPLYSIDDMTELIETAFDKLQR